MEHLGALSVLVRVVEAGSSSAVARARAAVAQPGEHFGVRLLRRTSENPLTHDGQKLLDLARPVVCTASMEWNQLSACSAPRRSGWCA
jgi:DNA-binding transcriptional LysR family regulator